VDVSTVRRWEARWKVCCCRYCSVHLYLVKSLSVLVYLFVFCEIHLVQNVAVLPELSKTMKLGISGRLFFYNSLLNLQVRYLVLVLHAEDVVYSTANVVKSSAANEIGGRNTMSFRLQDLDYDRF
jgi:hypothetical protein